MDAVYPQALRPTADECTVAAVFGQDLSIPALGALGPYPRRSPRAVLEAQLLGALERGPSFVSFSGGRDSSTLLAVAVSVARRHGLPDPVPLTTVFAHLPESDEEDFQRVVIDHLGVREWHRVDGGRELDVLGPAAQRVMRAHGVILPSNAHALTPLMETAGGGTLITGAGGDEILDNEVYRLSSALWSRRKIRRHAVRALAMHDAPPRIRRRWLRANSAINEFAWLTPSVRERLLDRDVEESLMLPARFDHLMDMTWQNRGIQTLNASPRTLAAPYGTHVLQPFITAEFLTALRRTWGMRFPGWRQGMLAGLVGDLLPPEIITRESKGDFARAFYTDRSRDWARAWDGTGLDPALVNVPELRAEWAKEYPNACTLGLLQQAWLATDGAAA